MKYFVSDVGQLKGRGGNTLKFDVNRREVEQEDFIDIINRFFEDAALAATGKYLVWDNLKHGQPVIVDDVCLTIKI